MRHRRSLDVTVLIWPTYTIGQIVITPVKLDGIKPKHGQRISGRGFSAVLIPVSNCHAHWSAPFPCHSALRHFVHVIGSEDECTRKMAVLSGTRVD